ncbi:hypothetical protein [Streptococcus acidominimus]|nr:hypothetical protein [Streptococcus acidominimus]
MVQWTTLALRPETRKRKFIMVKHFSLAPRNEKAQAHYGGPL